MSGLAIAFLVATAEQVPRLYRREGFPVNRDKLTAVS
jgi:hypothetical protein